MSTYVVLHKNGDGWTVTPGIYEASSARGAIAACARAKSLQGELVAIPSSSWKPLKVSTETKLKIA